MSGCSTTKFNKNALSLMEVLITIVILSFGLTIIIRSFMMSLRATQIARDYTTACLLVEDKLWEYESAGSIEADLNEEDQFPQPNSKFRYKLESEKISDSEENIGLNRVRLSVKWQEVNKPNNITVETLLKNIQE